MKLPFLSFTLSVQPPIQWLSGALSLGLKRPGREAGHSPPSTAEVKEYALMAWCLVKAQDNFFTFCYPFLVEYISGNMRS
jgi:hypothetical protein